MEKIYILILILGPGLLIEAWDSYIYHARRDKESVYDYIFKVASHGTVIFFIATTIYNFVCVVFKLYDSKATSLSEIMNRFDKMRDIGLYLIIAFVVGLIWWALYDFVVKKVTLKIANWIYKEKTGSEQLPYSSVFEKIFHDREITTHHIPVSIYQNGKYVTSGCIRRWNSPNSDIQEYELEYTEEIEKILRDDQNKEDDDKILFYIDREYYSPETNMLIKFYRSNRLEKHWDEKYKN